MFDTILEERVLHRLTSWMRFGVIFQRGALSILEVAGVVLIVRSIVPLKGKVDILVAVLGGALIIIGCLFEYLIWIRTVQVISPRLRSIESENIQLRQERERLISSILERAPRSAFTGTPPVINKEPNQP